MLEKFLKACHMKNEFSTESIDSVLWHYVGPHIAVLVEF